MSFTPYVYPAKIVNTDPSTQSAYNPSDVSPYWIPSLAQATGNNTGYYYNIYDTTSEVFQYIQVEDSSGNPVSSGSIVVSVTNGSIFVGSSTQGVSSVTIYPTVSDPFPLSQLSFLPTYSGGVLPQILINYFAVGASPTNPTASANYNVLCFAEGTMISCPGGERAIETLAAGSVVLTSSGHERVIRFVGRRMMDLSGDPSNAPVVIPAGAVGDGIPSRDLRLSPEHAVVLEGVLIPVRSLIGDVVTQEDVAQVTYYHIQLDDHDIVLAEGMPCETLLNTDDPSDFDNADDAVLTDAFLSPCLPRVTQGPLVDAARRRLRSRVIVSASVIKWALIAGLGLIFAPRSSFSK